MKVIDFKGFRKLPVCAKVMWGIACVLALIGIGTIMLSIFEIYEVKLCVSLAFCVASQLISTIGLRHYKDILYKEVGRK